MKIRGILTTVFALITVVSISIVGMCANYMITRQTTEKVEKNLKCETLELTNEFNSWMSGKIEILNTAAIYLETNKQDAEIKDYLASVLQNADEADEITDLYYGKNDGTMLDGTGVIFGESNDPRKKEWYIEASGQDGTVVTEPYADVLTGKLVVSVAKQVIDDNNKMEGVVSMNILIDTLKEQVASTQFGESGSAMLLASDGTIISYPDNKMVHKNISDLIQEKASTETLLTNDSGFMRYNQDGIEKVMVFQKMSSSNWIIAVSMNSDEAYEEIYTTQIILIFVLVFILIIVIILSSIISHLIASPINKLTIQAKRAAAGDLTVQIIPSGTYEIKELGFAFSDMITHIRNLVENINHASAQVLHSTHYVDQVSTFTKEIADEVSNATNNMAEDARGQLETSNKNNNMIIQMAEDIAHISTYSSSSKEVSDEVTKIVSEGVTTLEEQTNLMHDTIVSTERVKNAISLLDQKSLEIEEIVNVISNIADETNLLSLNASIEAARAGENGRGFSVVADQVGKLAIESSQSSANIEKLLKDILEKTAQSVDEINYVYQSVERQKESLDETKKTYQFIKDAIVNIVERISYIANEAIDLQKYSKELSNTIAYTTEVAEKNAEAIEEVASSTVEQSTSVEKINEEVKKLVMEANELTLVVTTFYLEK